MDAGILFEELGSRNLVWERTRTGLSMKPRRPTTAADDANPMVEFQKGARQPAGSS